MSWVHHQTISARPGPPILATSLLRYTTLFAAMSTLREIWSLQLNLYLLINRDRLKCFKFGYLRVNNVKQFNMLPFRYRITKSFRSGLKFILDMFKLQIGLSYHRDSYVWYSDVC